MIASWFKSCPSHFSVIITVNIVILFPVCSLWLNATRIVDISWLLALLHVVQTSSGPHSLLSNGYWGLFSQRWSWPLNSNQCWGQEWWNYTSTPPYPFMAWFVMNWAQREFYLCYVTSTIRKVSLSKLWKYL